MEICHSSMFTSCLSNPLNCLSSMSLQFFVTVMARQFVGIKHQTMMINLCIFFQCPDKYAALVFTSPP